MERLTRKKRHKVCDGGKHPTKYTSGHTFQEVVARLAAYEDTGLEPEEVVALQASNREIKKEALPLLQAKIEERLLILPFRPGTEYFGHCHVRNANPISRGRFYPPHIPTLGVDAWLTREEAEAALKEQEG